MSISKKCRLRNALSLFCAAAFISGVWLFAGCAPSTTNASTAEGENKAPAKESSSTKVKPKSLTATSKMSKLDMKFNELTDKEAAVLLHKGTERPWIGEYTDNKRKGTYICRRCNAALYKSESKFDSHCGWPSFDDEIKGAVARHVDADGQRTEIVCQNCDGHLGHVFLGEGFTAKNTRHCVNSISMRFIEEGKELPVVIRPEEKKEKAEVRTDKAETKTDSSDGKKAEK